MTKFIMPVARKWERIEDLAVLHLYRGKVQHDSREVAALAARRFMVNQSGTMVTISVTGFPPRIKYGVTE